MLPWAKEFSVADASDLTSHYQLLCLSITTCTHKGSSVGSVARYVPVGPSCSWSVSSSAQLRATARECTSSTLVSKQEGTWGKKNLRPHSSSLKHHVSPCAQKARIPQNRKIFLWAYSPRGLSSTSKKMFSGVISGLFQKVTLGTDLFQWSKGVFSGADHKSHFWE